jgi:hypothetical protein
VEWDTNGGNFLYSWDEFGWVNKIKCYFALGSWITFASHGYWVIDYKLVDNFNFIKDDITEFDNVMQNHWKGPYQQVKKCFG